MIVRSPCSLLLVLTALTYAGCFPAPRSDDTPAHEPEQPSRTTVAPSEAEPAAEDRLGAAGRAWVERTLAGMTLRQQAAQLVMPWISGASASTDRAEFDRMLRWVQQDEVGGLIVSTGRPEVLAAKLNAAQAGAAVPLLIVSDLETGPGMRLSASGTDLPPAMAFGAADDEALSREAGRVTAREARAVGIHLTLGPVLDVNSNPENPIINVRSFGENPARVAALANAWRLGAAEEGLLSAGKHFPGHGDTEIDSHVGLATILADSARLAEVELVPFRRAMQDGMDGVLVGHIAVIGVEGGGAPPASLSRRMIGDLLRTRMRFDGLVFTDALNMGAVTRRFSVEEASLRALEAGADILLQPPGASRVIDAIVAAVESGRLSRERVAESAHRVLVAKAVAGLHHAARVSVDSVPLRVGVPAHRELARRVAQASITLAHDPKSLVPISPDAGRILHIVYTRNGQGSAGQALTRELIAAGAQVEMTRIGGRTGSAAYAALSREARSAALVLVTVSVSPHQYQAMNVQRGLATLVNTLVAEGRPVLVISLGSPYLMSELRSAPAYLLAWSASQASQVAAAGALLGKAPIRGRLPISIPPRFAAGAGVDR